MLAGLAAIALVWSRSPERTIAGVSVVRPSAMLVWLLPMFRSYARFGVVVQLMAVLLAGIGIDGLWRTKRAVPRAACVALIVLAIGEYTVVPSAMWRDVLPTSAHRWLMTQSGQVHALDCTPLTQESESVQWLTGNRITMSGGALDDCLEPGFAEKLAVNGYTHLLVRAGTPNSRRLTEGAPPLGLRRVASMPDGTVFEVAAPLPVIHIEAMDGLSPREGNETWTWRWMSADASWTIVNRSGQVATATLEIELEAFATPRRLQLRLDGREVGTLAVDVARRRYATGPISVPPGAHSLTFHSIEPPVIADTLSHNGDLRMLTFAVGDWRWTVRQDHP